MSKKLSALGFDFYGSDSCQELFAIRDFISTGNYNLNRIIGGSLFKGIPEKKVAGLIGEEATGKSLFALCIAREAQKKGHLVAYFDSENALTPEFAKAAGVDIDNLIYRQVITIEEFRAAVIGLIKWKTEEYSPEKPILLILDSYGGLTAKKFMQDHEIGKDSMDMGIFAKVSKATFKYIGSLMAPHNITFLYTNHVMTDSGGYIPIKVQTGGMVGRYYPSTIIMLKRKIVKTAEGITGVNLVAQNTKSRIVPPFQTATVYLDWQDGLDPYSGLFEIAVDMGLISGAGGWFQMEGDPKKYRKKDLEKDLWADDVFLKKLDVKIQDQGYKTIESVTDELFVTTEVGVTFNLET